jgi:hypothetical protein
MALGGEAVRGNSYSPQIGVSIGRLIEDLELLIRCATDDELRNRIIYLPLQ